MFKDSYKIILNGIELKDPISKNGTPYLEGISLSNINRIEIISGSNSILYGSNAIAGIIKLYTNKFNVNKKGQVSLLLSNHANHTSFGYGAKIQNTTAQFNVSRSFNKKKSWIKNTNEKDGTSLQTISLNLNHSKKLNLFTISIKCIN